jgi:hypothetical protein
MMKKSSESLHYSLAEFAYILLFISIGIIGFVIIFYNKEIEKIEGELQEVKIKLSSTLQKLDITQKELKEANEYIEILKKKEKTVPPCWSIPNSPIPKVIGELKIWMVQESEVLGNATIERMLSIEISDNNERKIRQGFIYESDITLMIVQKINFLFDDEMNFNEQNGCYLRINLINFTNESKLSALISSELEKHNIVVKEVYTEND